MVQSERCRRHDSATRALHEWSESVRAGPRSGAADPVGRERSPETTIARRLGAHVAGDHAELGFWVPDLDRVAVEPDSLVLEIATPVERIAWKPVERVQMRIDRIPVDVRDGFVWVAIRGMRVGTRDGFGSFYWLRGTTRAGGEHLIRDPLAHSVPFGVHAPAELYDVATLQADRKDEPYFRSHGGTIGRDDPPRFGPPANILQLHVGTATPSGTLGELADLYRSIASKVRDDSPLSPAEQNFVGYDALQLLPVEPVIEYADGGAFFVARAGAGDAGPDEAVVELRRPAMTNWGYDVPIAGSAAINPAILRTGRPDELRELAEVLHTFPGSPIRLILDVVFGHSDNQGRDLLPGEFFSGPNMYGQDMSFRHPMVRAIMLEMQRRKVDFGADGVRVDGAQDFKYYDADTDTVHHDDAYLVEMSAVVQQVAGAAYRPFMIFEDGRPWPREDWETASTYRAVIDDQPHAFQWGPLTFAHNTPCLAGFWNAKWWRIEEICRHGSHWVSGCANHDTLRRGYQIATDRTLNTRLGETLPEILERSYDHPAATLLAHGIFPGAPMEFIAATMRAPWAFIRNTDDVYGVKIAAEEAEFLTWRVDGDRFARAGSFERIKDLGYGDLAPLRSFLSTLSEVVAGASYDLSRIATDMRDAGFGSVGPATSDPLDPAALQRFSRAFMDDLHAYCLVARFADELDPAQTAYNLAVRTFRRQHRWLQRDFGPHDRLERVVDPSGGTFVTGARTSPDGTEHVLLVANLEGDPYHVSLAEAATTGRLSAEGWRVACASPGVTVPGDRVDSDHVLELSDAQAILLWRQV